jgi:hypothetical protein
MKKYIYLFFLFACLWATLFADTSQSAREKILVGFQYKPFEVPTVSDDVVVLKPFPVIAERIDTERSFRKLYVLFNPHSTKSESDDSSGSKIFGISFAFDGYSEGPLESLQYAIKDLRQMEKRLRGGVPIGSNATLYIRTGIRWKSDWFPKGLEVWLPFRHSSIWGVGIRIDDKAFRELF